MLKTLHGKLAAVLLGLLVLIGVFYVLLTLFSTQAYYQEVAQKLNYHVAKEISHHYLGQGGSVDRAELRGLFASAKVKNPSIELYLLGPDGSIELSSEASEELRRARVDLGPVHTFLDEEEVFPLFGDDPLDASRQKVFSASAIPAFASPEEVQGYLYIVLGGRATDSAIQMLQGSYILRLSTGLAAGGLIFVLIAGMLLFRLLTQRLRKLANAVEGFRQSDFAEPTDLYRPRSRLNDEIDRLGTVIGQMAERIQQQFKDLKAADAQRRELITNVSHDLRTPLAALQGYLETLLIKAGQLSPDEQEHYLHTALKHSERLGKLVGELFELSKLDAHQVSAKFETFSPAELVQDVVQKFQLLAEQRRINVHTAITATPFIRADLGMIERVLTNLLDNALRHTPENGSVSVILEHTGNKVKLTIQDTGSGINQHELPHIFERFYRAPRTQREGETLGAGLGLAISKRIVELHGGDIEAHSVPNQGSSFSFSLPTNPTGAAPL